MSAERNHTEIVVVMDRSGSMENLKLEAIGAFNNFLEDQRYEQGTATVTLVLFNTEYEIKHLRVPLEDVDNLGEDEFRCHGMTALYDAAGRAIEDLTGALVALPNDQKPQNVVFAIITDGEENRSHRFSAGTLKRLVDDRTQHEGWNFTFIGSHESNEQLANSIGIDSTYFLRLRPDSAGAYGAGFDFLSQKVSEVRQSGKMTGYNDAQRNAAF